jgi:hypothetical protein
MKITYSERKTVNLGNYESKSVEITLENAVNFENHTVETAYNEIKNFVVTKLEEALKEKPRGTVAKKVKAEVVQEKEQIVPITNKEIENNLDNEKVLNVCKAISKFKNEYAGVIRAECDRLNISIPKANNEQLEVINNFLVAKMLEWGITYNSETNAIEEVNDKWGDL